MPKYKIGLTRIEYSPLFVEAKDEQEALRIARHVNCSDSLVDDVLDYDYETTEYEVEKECTDEEYTYCNFITKEEVIRVEKEECIYIPETWEDERIEGTGD